MLPLVDGDFKAIITIFHEGRVNTLKTNGNIEILSRKIEAMKKN